MWTMMTETVSRLRGYQYGVPMNESLLCRMLEFLADTPKSAEETLHNYHINEWINEWMKKFI